MFLQLPCCLLVAPLYIQLSLGEPCLYVPWALGTQDANNELILFLPAAWPPHPKSSASVRPSTYPKAQGGKPESQGSLKFITQLSNTSPAPPSTSILTVSCLALFFPHGKGKSLLICLPPGGSLFCLPPFTSSLQSHVNGSP